VGRIEAEAIAMIVHVSCEVLSMSNTVVKGLGGGKLGDIEHSADHVAKSVGRAVLFGKYQVHEAIQLQPC
jgi:hypothetical protein